MPDVLDISSDEEEGLKEETRSSDLDWIQELLFNSDDESDADSDVVIIHENKPPELKSKSSKDAVDDDDDDDDGVDDDDDDDCVVLEGDPENGVTSVDEEDSTGSDELVVVGEKGQLVLISQGVE
ncbi:hypothetical protein L195_g041603 [Trifolium pratense]|uniref:Uncharacterized protein n=1 Tax=Trifolium pratense TaxID=57577 RepID=A0A2K3M446_TRIPR|nr:hypothetical protein L195_g041603 [Trifolium pratense]